MNSRHIICNDHWFRDVSRWYMTPPVLRLHHSWWNSSIIIHSVRRSHCLRFIDWC